MTQNERSRLYNIIGQRICMLRQAKGFSQQEFAIKLRISRASVVNIEKGRQQAPLHLLWLIAESLDTQIHQLIPLQDEIKVELDGSSLRLQVREQVGNNKEDENRVVEFIQSVYSK
jgi:transcriptional regulator with XRE-family HTH domain